MLSISPHGERVFTDEFTVVDVASGDATTLPVPKFDRPGLGYWSALNLTTFWEDDDHLVLLVPGENQAIFSFVRCEISTNSCERASDELQVDDPPRWPLATRLRRCCWATRDVYLHHATDADLANRR